MATIAKPRNPIKSVKEEDFEGQPTIQEPVKNTPPRGGMGSCKKVLSDDEIRNAGQYEDKTNEQTDEKPDTVEPTSASTDTQPDSDRAETSREGTQKVVQEVSEKEQARRLEFSKIKKEKINEAAEEILSCLEPLFAREFKLACNEMRCADIGIYILAILNRLSKEADYYNPDFEAEWEKGVVGYNDDLYCEYCSKKIENPDKLKQRFCSNLCARYFRETQQTGVIYPDEHTLPGKSEEEIEREAYEAELKRTGGN